MNITGAVIIYVRMCRMYAVVKNYLYIGIFMDECYDRQIVVEPPLPPSKKPLPCVVLTFVCPNEGAASCF